MATLTARHATVDDGRLLWEWANDPIVRAASFTHDRIPWDAHVAWLDARVAAAAPTYVIENEARQPVGQVRFDARPDGAMEVGLSLGAAFRGRRLSRPALVAACRALRQERGPVTVVAHVRPDNAASLATFRSAGFEPAGSEHVKGCESLRLELRGEPR